MPTLYRIVRERQFTREDVRSNLARCQARRAAELHDVAIWAGISMYDTPEAAGATARKYGIGVQLARFDLPDSDPRVVLGHRSSTGHVTVWACEDLLSSFFQTVLPIP